MAASILLVEDDRTSRRNLAAFLRSTGYEVYEAQDGEIALSLLTSTQFDVVISDLNLPGDLSGIDILDALKSLPRKIDGILITGTGSDDVKSRAKSLGAAYLIWRAYSTKRTLKDDPGESKEIASTSQRLWDL